MINSKNEIITIDYLICEAEEDIDIIERQKLLLICCKKYGFKFIKEIGYC